MSASLNNLILKSAIIILVCGLLLTGCVPGGGRFEPNPWAGPVVSDDTLFVVSKDQGKLLAIDAIDLADNKINVLWKFAPEPDYGGGGFGCTSAVSTELLVYGNPAVDEEMVYIASYDGVVYAINSGSASREYANLIEYERQKEKPDTEDVAITNVGIDMDDVVDLGVIFKDQGEQIEDRLGVQGTLGGQMAWLELAVERNIITEEQAGAIREYVTVRGIRWVHDTESNIVSSPVLSDNVLVVASGDKLDALDVRNGTSLWGSFEADGEIWGNPVISHGNVYFGTLEHGLYAVDLESGNEVWKKEFGGAITSTPLVVEDTVYIGTFENKFYALDASSGEAKWDQPFEAENWFYTTPVYSDGTVFVGNLDHSVYAIDADTGKEKWDRPFGTGGAIRAAAKIVDNTLLIASKDGFVYRLDPKSGFEESNKIDLEKKILADPFISGSTAYMIDHDDNLHMINLESWREESPKPLDDFNPPR
ncbi:MAG: PQQ-binding-like beta-propeller repeat protein [Chloroflexi bacterium]|nr:PQQ-binding-like beta-propeller repeat protein [Chloroflexota bacterium]